MPARDAFISCTVLGAAEFDAGGRGVELTLAAGRVGVAGALGAALGVYVVTPFGDLTPGVAAGAAGASAREPGV
jgi:hypothetical protein